MEVFNGIYSWDGKRHGPEEPIAWFAGSYYLQIYDLTDGDEKLRYLKPYLCIYSETGDGHSISAHPEKFAKQVCNDFSLNLERVLWVEQFTPPNPRYEVIAFSRTSEMADRLFYQIQKRPPTESELGLIKKELQNISPRILKKPQTT